MPAGSIDLTAVGIYGANYGNFANTNTLPGGGFVRSRLVATSAIKPYGASADVGYKIMTIPSYTLVTNVFGVVVTSASAAVECSCGIGDADASTTWISDCSITVLGPPTQAGKNVSYELGTSILGPSHFLVGKYYSNGGEIQIAFTASEARARVQVVVTGVNLSPV